MKSKIVVYVHRTHRMKNKNKTTFQKGERPRVEVNLGGHEPVFMYADQFTSYIINNFEYGGCDDG